MKKKSRNHYNIPIFIPHEGCPHGCIFCNQKKITGVETSVTPQDAEKIIEEYLSYIPKTAEHIEAAFFGGSFTGLDLITQEAFLKTAAKYSHRIDGIRMSTRPDYINEEVLALAKKYNVKTIELGLQSADDEVLALNERGHTFEDTVKAAKMIKEMGISLGLQMMIGMYGSTPQKDIFTALKTAELEPVCVRIYPTLTLSSTKLNVLYNNGVYKPYSLEQAIDITDSAMRIFEKKNIEIIRVGLHSDESLTSDNNIVAGPYHPAFRELILNKRWREKIENKIIEANIKDREYIIKAPKEKWPEIIGHKRCNKEYFKEKYNVSIKLEESLKVIN